LGSFLEALFCDVCVGIRLGTSICGDASSRFVRDRSRNRRERFAAGWQAKGEDIHSSCVVLSFESLAIGIDWEGAGVHILQVYEHL